MSVTLWDIAQEKLYQNCMDSPKDAEEFCMGCPFTEHDFMGAHCDWNFEPDTGCPREEEYRNAFEKR